MNEKQLQELIKAIRQTQKQWLTTGDLETEFGIHKSTQSKMRTSKTLPYHKIGKNIKYYRPDINKMFLDSKVV